jgi:hypothetical protein
MKSSTSVWNLISQKHLLKRANGQACNNIRPPTIKILYETHLRNPFYRRTVYNAAYSFMPHVTFGDTCPSSVTHKSRSEPICFSFILQDLFRVESEWQMAHGQAIVVHSCGFEPLPQLK